MNLHLCHRCPHVQPPPYAGPCACTIDGKDIIEHAQSGHCPKGYFDKPEAMPRRDACMYRGLMVDEVQCETCTGKTMIKVFSCPIHWRCTVATKVPGTAVCVSCPDRRSE